MPCDAPEPGSLWKHRRTGRWVRIERVVARRGSDWVKVYFQLISGPEYQLHETKNVSSAVQHWFLKTYEFAEPAVHEDDAPQA